VAGAAIIADRILLVLAVAGLTRIRFELRLLCMLLRGRSAVRHGLAKLRNSRMMPASHRPHGNRSSQRIAAK